MKRNQNFDPNHSQKVLSCHYNMDTNRWKPGSRIALCCIKQWMPNDSILS